jgi:class 3 adenylate cyclase/tetratricopeptide (TPR) repeat protein
MSDLSAYIPQDRRWALLHGEELPNRAAGTALLADVSGFTPLAERLIGDFGPRRGAEELTALLNQVFAALIVQVEAFGGSVIGFAGDAITCWFAEAQSHHRLTDSPTHQRALACALTLQQAMLPFAALTIKVAIVSGPVRRFVVGDPDIQLLDLLAGRSIDKLGRLAALALPGEVVTDESTLALFGALVLATERRGDPKIARTALVVRASARVLAVPNQQSALVALPNSLTQAWVHPAVRARLQAGGATLLAELRPVSVLMLQFSGIDYDNDPDAALRLDRFVQVVQRELARSEGMLLDIMMADAGGYLYAVYGAPVAHEDDARRALLAALRLTQAPPESLTLRIGVSRGSMRVGPYGSANRCAYGVLGDAANLAHRLMSRAAPGEVLLSAQARNGLEDYARWQTLPPMQLKGKRFPIAVYQALGTHDERPAKNNTAGSLVGREAERRQIASVLREFQQGQGATLLIEGDPGIGKSRLVAELCAQAAIVGLTQFIGASDAMMQATPYHAWQPVVRQLPGLSAMLLQEFAERAPLLNVLLDLHLPESPFTAQLSGQARADNLNELVLALLERCARTAPLLLVLEDSHWFDSASWALLLLVQRRLAHTLLVVTTRPVHPPSADEQRLRSAPRTHRLQLTGLTPGETLQLACRQLGVASLPPVVAEVLQSKGEGNPFFSSELVATLHEAGLLVVEAGICHVPPGADPRLAMLPETVQGVIASRIDRLRPDQQLVLKVASVIGRTFAYQVLRDIHPLTSEQAAVRPILEELQQLDLTLLEWPDPALTYLFKHVLTQEATYATLLYAQRRALHQAVASWYERTYSGSAGVGLAPYYGLLAYHWERAEQQAQARHYQELAGEQALRAGAYREAAAFFGELSSAGADQPPLLRARWHRRYGEALLGLGELAPCREQLEQALVALEAPIRAHDLGWLARHNAIVLLRLVRQHLRGEHAGEPPTSERTLELVGTYHLLGVLFTYSSEGLAGVYSTLQAASLLGTGGPAGDQQRLAAALGLTAGLSSLHGLAQHFFQRARAVDASADQAATSFVLQVEGLYWTAIGNWSQAYAIHEQVLAQAEQRGDWRQFAEVLTHIGSACCFQTDFERGLLIAERLNAEAQRNNNLVYRLWGANIAGRCLLGLGRLAEARLVLEEGWRLRDHSGFIGPTSGLTAYGLVGVYLWQGQQEAAGEAAVNAATNLGKPFPVFYLGLMNYVAIAQMALARWEVSPQNGSLRRLALDACLRLFIQALLFPIGRPVAWLQLGHCARLASWPLLARLCWQKSLHHARRLAMPYDQAQAHMALGQHATGELRCHHLGYAIALFASLGAQADLRRAVGLGRAFLHKSGQGRRS